MNLEKRKLNKEKKDPFLYNEIVKTISIFPKKERKKERKKKERKKEKIYMRVFV